MDLTLGSQVGFGSRDTVMAQILIICGRLMGRNNYRLSDFGTDPRHKAQGRVGTWVCLHDISLVTSGVSDWIVVCVVLLLLSS